MGMSLTNLRTELRYSLGVDSIDFPNPRVDELLNRALWELTEKFPFRETETSTDFTLLANTAKYTMPGNFEALLDITILDPNTNQWTALLRSTKVNYDSSLNTTVVPVSSAVIPCEYVRDNDCIIFFPTPVIGYDVKMRYIKSITDLTDNTATLGLPQSWGEIVLLGATWRGFISLGDYERANAAKSHQISLISSSVPVEAKEEFDTHYGGVEVYGRDRRL